MESLISHQQTAATFKPDYTDVGAAHKSSRCESVFTPVQMINPALLQAVSRFMDGCFMPGVSLIGRVG